MHSAFLAVLANLVNVANLMNVASLMNVAWLTAFQLMRVRDQVILGNVVLTNHAKTGLTFTVLAGCIDISAADCQEPPHKLQLSNKRCVCDTKL